MFKTREEMSDETLRFVVGGTTIPEYASKITSILEGLNPPATPEETAAAKDIIQYMCTSGIVAAKGYSARQTKLYPRLKPIYDMLPTRAG